MHCKVRAGPATRMPGVRATGPRIWALRMPSLDSSLLTVALPIPDSLDTSAGSGRWMSGVSTMVWLFLSACLPHDLVDLGFRVGSRLRGRHGLGEHVLDHRRDGLGPDLGPLRHERHV